MIAAGLLVGLLAWGPQSGILDMPYPEVDAAPPPEAQVAETLQHYVRGLAHHDADLAGALHPDFTRVTIRRNGVRPDAVEVATARSLADGPIVATTPRYDVSQVKVEGGHASAKVTFADRVELVHLVLWNHEWRVVQSLAEAN